MNYLEADSIRLAFGDRYLLNDIYVRLNAGEIVGLLGRNGSGKSTLLSVIYGILPVDQACIKLNGTYVPKLYRFHNQVAYLPQRSFIPSFLRVEQAFNLYKVDVDAVRDYFQGVNEWLPSRFSELSTGQQRLIETLLITGSPASLILLDEPFSGISPLEIEQLSTWLVYCKQTKGILIVDHYYRTVLALSDRVYLLTGQGQTKQLKNPLVELRQLGYLPD